MDLIRELMLKLEALDIPPGGYAIFTSEDDEIAIPERSSDDIARHLIMIYDAGLAHGSRFASGEWRFHRLTPEGHDFLDTFRDPATWRKAKALGSKAGSTSLSVLLEIGKALAKEAVRTQLAKLGIPLG